MVLVEHWLSVTANISVLRNVVFCCKALACLWFYRHFFGKISEPGKAYKISVLKESPPCIIFQDLIINTKQAGFLFQSNTYFLHGSAQAASQGFSEWFLLLFWYLCLLLSHNFVKNHATHLKNKDKKFSLCDSHWELEVEMWDFFIWSFTS